MKRNLFLSAILCVCLLVAAAGEGYAKINKKKLYRTVEVLTSDSLAGRAAGSGYDLKTARYIEQELLKMGYEPFYPEGGVVEFDYKTRRASGKSYNVIMALSPVPTPGYVLLGAHHDHLGVREYKDGHKEIYRGANDNACGVASLIEIAREISQQRKQLQHNVIIAAFGAEEIGLLGSRAMVEQFSKEGVALKFMLNLEMTGALDAAKQVEVLGSDTFDMVSALKQTPNRDGLDFMPLKADTHGSDHLSFVEQCPVAVFATTGSQDYHTPKDTIESINFEGMRQLTQYISNFIGSILQRKQFAY